MRHNISILAVVMTRTLRPYGKPTQPVVRGQHFVFGNFLTLTLATPK